jgi:seryl-tRNA synthetase
MTDKGSISWGKMGRQMNSSNSLAFMEIRLRSLSKALDEVKTKRIRLEQALRRGHVPESEYASSLLKLIVESNKLTKEQEEITERVKALKNEHLVSR